MLRREKKPHLQTEVGIFTVSSVKYDMVEVHDEELKVALDVNETCVFNEVTNDSEVVGDYDCHQFVVAAIKFVYDSLKETYSLGDHPRVISSSSNTARH